MARITERRGERPWEVHAIRERGPVEPTRLRTGKCDRCAMEGKTLVDGKWLCAPHALEAVGGPKVR